MSVIIDKLNEVVENGNFKKKVKSSDLRDDAFSVYRSLYYCDETLDLLSSKVLKFPNAVKLIALTLKRMINSEEKALDALIYNMDELLNESNEEKLSELQDKIVKVIIRENLKLHEHLQSMMTTMREELKKVDISISNTVIETVSKLVPVIVRDVIEENS